MSDDISPQQTARTEDTQPSAGKGKQRPLIILFCITCVVAVLCLKWLISSRTNIATDNAFIEARVVPVSSRIAGTVQRVLVTDNQRVSKGDLLVEIDQRDYQVQVNRAEAGVGMAENESGGERQRVEAADAALQSALARQEQALLDLERGEKLYSREVLPREQLDRLRTARRVADAQTKEARERLRLARAEAGLAASGTAANRARVMQRQAQLDEAKLQLSYTRIYAPQDGFITKKSIEPGVNIQAGQPLLALVPLSNAWVTANYKESQLTHIKPGQKVQFTVDAYPGRTFSGTVDSIMAGTGAAFSLLPPENATGNYVKVVQRVPVKITIDAASDPDHQLRVGMSVIPVIRTGRTGGDVLREIVRF